ncbi:LysR family transcriptional regulator [Nocardia sp. NBC_00508]|uniref:LysR family transcriptional regulator n=1 Tax=Nocardia sp. NBC_00508 TaxID=2975992 RepID=UPI002E8178E8|nr:LysR substrate-binding domain-containing protein [Nocardia sp. NBC_00508]WUD65313.1 LysR family transcriptional regulator [Nocardia sp. NBC_00508]
MELRQLRYFVVLAEELHFRRAAERLFISTPTLSQQIKVMERELGGPLLVREPRVALTPAGAALLRAGKNVLASMDVAIRETRRAAAAGAPVFRLGLLNGVPPWLPERIDALLAGQLPGVRTVLTGGTTADQVRLLDADEVDLALVRIPVELPERFVKRPVAREELGVLMSARHPLAGASLLAPADLSGQELILFPRESAAALHDSLLRTLADQGATVRLSDSAMGYAQMLAVLPSRPDVIGLGSARAAELPGLVWRPVRGAPLVLTYAVAWRAAVRHPAVPALVASLAEKLFTR